MDLSHFNPDSRNPSLGGVGVAIYSSPKTISSLHKIYKKNFAVIQNPQDGQENNQAQTQWVDTKASKNKKTDSNDQHKRGTKPHSQESVSCKERPVSSSACRKHWIVTQNFCLAALQRPFGDKEVQEGNKIINHHRQVCSFFVFADAQGFGRARPLISLRVLRIFPSP